MRGGGDVTHIQPKNSSRFSPKVHHYKKYTLMICCKFCQMINVYFTDQKQIIEEVSKIKK